MHCYRLEAIWDYFKNLHCLESQSLQVLILFTLGLDKSQHLSNKIVQTMWTHKSKQDRSFIDEDNNENTQSYR